MSNITTHKHHKLLVILAFATIYIVWGSTYFFIHKALQGFQPFMLGAIRFTLAGIIILVWCKFKGYGIFNWNVIRAAAVPGMLLLFIDTGIIIWVEQFLASGLVAIMAASAAIWFVLLDKPKWKENFTNVPTISGVFMGFLGVVMLFGEQLATTMTLSQRQTNLTGMLLLVGGAIAWTAGSLFSKYHVPKNSEQKNTPVMVGIGWQILLAGGAFIVAAGVRGEIQVFDIQSVPAQAWWSILYLISFGSIIAYSAYIWLLSVRPATEVSTYAYVNPIVAVVLSIFLTDETITSVQITGLVIILVSVLLINWRSYMKPSAKLANKRTLRPRLKPTERREEKAAVFNAVPDNSTNGME